MLCLQGKTPQKQPCEEQNAQLSICLWGIQTIVAGLKLGDSVMELWTYASFIFRRVNLEDMKYFVLY